MFKTYLDIFFVINNFNLLIYSNIE